MCWNFILPIFALPFNFFSHQAFWHFHKEILLGEIRQWFYILVCNFFTAKHYRSRWENQDRSQYRFQPIKFVNFVVPRRCETEPYNKLLYQAIYKLITFNFNLRWSYVSLNWQQRRDYQQDQRRSTPYRREGQIPQDHVLCTRRKCEKNKHHGKTTTVRDLPWAQSPYYTWHQSSVAW